MSGLLGAITTATFAGVGSKTADDGSYTRAVKMLNSGTDPAKVWKETGWGVGPDGKMRYEISDHDAKFIPNNQWSNGQGASFRAGVPAMDKMQNMVPHGSFNNAYPGVNPMVLIDPANRSESATHNKGLINMGHINGQPPISTLLHERQHAVQGVEGFAKGGNAKTNGQDEYNRLAGEAEARLVQARKDMTPEQRRQSYPWEPAYFLSATGVPLGGLLYNSKPTK